MYYYASVNIEQLLTIVIEGDSLECENELALFVIQGIEKNRQMATRDIL